MSVVDPETKRKGIETAVKVALIAVAAAVSVPLASMALEGLLLWAAVGAIVLLAWGAGPAIATLVANKRIEYLKAVIAENPIETMENLYADKVNELAAQSKAITEVDTQYRNVQQMVNRLQQTDPSEAKDYAEIVDKIHEGLTAMEADYDYAKDQLEQFKAQIDKAQRIWNVAVAINKALAVSEKARADVFRDIKTKVAFDTVTTNLNRAFARLDSSVREHRNAGIIAGPQEAPKALPEASTTQVIDLGNVKAAVRR